MENHQIIERSVSINFKESEANGILRLLQKNLADGWNDASEALFFYRKITGAFEAQVQIINPSNTGVSQNGNLDQNSDSAR